MNLEASQSCGDWAKQPDMEAYAKEIEASTKRAAAVVMGKFYMVHLRVARKYAKKIRDSSDLREIDLSTGFALEQGAAASALFFAIRTLLEKPYRNLKL